MLVLQAGRFFDEYESRTAHQTMLYAVKIYNDYVDEAAPFQVCCVSVLLRKNALTAVRSYFVKLKEKYYVPHPFTWLF